MSILDEMMGMDKDFFDMSDIEPITEIAKAAGHLILNIYNDPVLSGQAELKADNSPLTLADTSSHQYILKQLNSLYPDVPVLSEENSSQITFDHRKYWSRYWLVDPLDGTKEFLNRNGEFTVNIALIENNEPVMGVVYAPYHNLMYYAKKGCGAYKVDNLITYQLPLQCQRGDNCIIAVVSKSHSGELLPVFLDNYQKQQNKPIKTISMGSSLKSCLVAEGAADIYPRFAPTMEWDIAAADIIVRESGRTTLTVDTKKPLIYNKPNLVNPFFIVS